MAHSICQCAFCLGFCASFVRLGLVAAVLLAWRLRLRWLVPGRFLAISISRAA